MEIKMRIVPVIDESGLYYTIQSRSWFVWCDLLPDFYEGKQRPNFTSPKGAVNWIKARYGNRAKIQETRLL